MLVICGLFSTHIENIHFQQPLQKSRLELSLTLSLPQCLMKFCKVTLTLESVDGILWCDHSNKSSLPVLTRCYLFFKISQSEIWKFGWNGSERVKCYLYNNRIMCRITAHTVIDFMTSKMGGGGGLQQSWLTVGNESGVSLIMPGIFPSFYEHKPWLFSQETKGKKPTELPAVCPFNSWPILTG